jgi:hypothetical protein
MDALARTKAKIIANLDNLIVVWLADNLDVTLIDIYYRYDSVRVIYKEEGMLKDIILYL